MYLQCTLSEGFEFVEQMTLHHLGPLRHSHIKTQWKETILHNDYFYLTHSEITRRSLSSFLWLTAPQPSHSSRRNPGDFYHMETLFVALARGDWDLSENIAGSERAARRERCRALGSWQLSSQRPLRHTGGVWYVMCSQSTCLFRWISQCLLAMCASPSTAMILK